MGNTIYNQLKIWQNKANFYYLSLKLSRFRGKKPLIVFTAFLLTVSPVFGLGFRYIFAQKDDSAKSVLEIGQLAIFQQNTLMAGINPTNPDPKVARNVLAIITAYSSTVWQTDDTPFVTAAGTNVRDGIIANNILPFGTKVRIPTLYGDKIFVVEDKMSWKKGNYHFDIWFENYWDALNFGAQNAYIEILEN